MVVKRPNGGLVLRWHVERPLPGLTGLADGLAPKSGATRPDLVDDSPQPALGPPLPVVLRELSGTSKPTSPQKHLRVEGLAHVGRSGHGGARAPLGAFSASAAGGARRPWRRRRDVLRVLPLEDAGGHLAVAAGLAVLDRRPRTSRSGASSSRFGPTCATAFDAASVWQVAQRSPNSSRPCFCCLRETGHVRVRGCRCVVDRTRSRPPARAMPSSSNATTKKQRWRPCGSPRDCEWSAAPRPRRPPLSAMRNGRGRGGRRRGRRGASSFARNLPFAHGARMAPAPGSPASAHRRRPEPKLWTAGATSRNSPSVAAAARPPCAPSPRPVAAAATRRSASSTTRASRSSGVTRARHRLDEHVDRAAGLRQPLEPALAQQQRLARTVSRLRLVEVRRDDQVDRRRTRPRAAGTRCPSRCRGAGARRRARRAARWRRAAIRSRSAIETMPGGSVGRSSFSGCGRA